MTRHNFSQAADNNKDHVLGQLRRHLAPGAEILEIGSGTAQHALHFAQQMPDIVWQPTDRDLEAYGLTDAVIAAQLDNLRPPIVLDASNFPDFDASYDAVYSANCIHIMPGQYLESYVVGASRALKPGGMMMLYGPFKYDGHFTTQSNERFDAFLRGNYEDGGVRDFEQVDRLADENRLVLQSDTDMPANNQFLVWQKRI